MKSKLKSIAEHCKTAGVYICMLCLMALPAIGFAQPAPPGPGGGNPDSPLGVPFDDHLNLLLLLAGVVFAVIKYVKQQKEKLLILDKEA
jgi:hypothetical protein